MDFGWLIIAGMLFGLFLLIYKSQDAMFFVNLFKKNLFYIFLIGIIVFFAFSLYNIQNNYDIDLKSYDGAVEASNIYWIWLKSVGHNMVRVTGYVVEQDWWLNETSESGGR